MRTLVAIIATFALSCGSTGPVIDANEGGAPFAFVGAGFPERVDVPATAVFVPLELRFLFTNVSDRPYTVDRLMVHQGNVGTTRVAFNPASVKVGRMIEPGEDLELDVPIHAERRLPQAGESVRHPIHVEANLVLLDGTRYRYSVAIPFQW